MSEDLTGKLETGLGVDVEADIPTTIFGPAFELKPRWERERQAFRERSALIESYERPVVALRAMHMPHAPIVAVLSHRDIDEVLGNG